MSGIVRINLLPDATHCQNVARARGKVWVIVLSLTVVSSALTWQWSSRRDGEVSRADERMEAALTEAHRQKRTASSLAARLTVLESRLATLDAMRGPESWSKRVGIIVKSVPAEMVLTRLNAATRITGGTPMAHGGTPAPQGEARPAQSEESSLSQAERATRMMDGRSDDEVRIDGFALTNTDIAMFLRRLKESRLFRNVDLVSSSRETRRGRVVQSFGITCAR